MDRFQEPRNLIQWSRDAIEEGWIEFSTYCQDGAFEFRNENDPETGDDLFKAVQIKPLPLRIARKWTEAVNNLRNSFDQALFSACNEIARPIKDGHYPFAESPTGFERRLTSFKKKSTIPPALWNEIRRQQPYATGESHVGGNDLVIEIAKTANAKHTIGFDVTGSVTGVSADYIQIDEIGPGGVLEIGGPMTWDPIKKEVIIFRGRKTSMSHKNAKITVNVFFKRPGLLQGIPARQALTRFANHAQFVLEGFEAACTAINNSGR